MRIPGKRVFFIGGILLIMVTLSAAFFPALAKSPKPPATTVSPYVLSDKECFTCHEMNPEIATWKVSSHSKIPCTACHNVNIADYQTNVKLNQKPITMVDIIPDSVCEQCHSFNRLVTPGGDLKIPHEKHKAAEVACVKCHAGVVHAKISERGITTEGKLSDYNSWNENAAKQVAVSFYTKPDMWTCINCHKAASVTTRCGICHSQIPALPTHENPTWISEHGKFAENNIGECTKCHVTPGKPMFVTPSTGNMAADFARAQQFCYTCHNKRPEMHVNSWTSIHPQSALKKGLKNCLACHDVNQPKVTKKVTGTYCNQCHWLPSPLTQPKAGNVAK